MTKICTVQLKYSTLLWTNDVTGDTIKCPTFTCLWYFCTAVTYWWTYADNNRAVMTKHFMMISISYAVIQMSVMLRNVMKTLKRMTGSFHTSNLHYLHHFVRKLLVIVPYFSFFIYLYFIWLYMFYFLDVLSLKTKALLHWCLHSHIKVWFIMML